MQLDFQNFCIENKKIYYYEFYEKQLNEINQHGVRGVMFNYR